ncbi:hypothetical protein DFA_02500 [Cavenderia fasciculata]|uniref:Major facilitator superfamily (MFS) profile domain-containing protein n=1 Tax=Cavenderia fasciculata TaxID=261658 RepID=F4PZJ7_CACFS|nr:uncharacterized protein DFA_02500 [Cavenderia fasciculata]EGG18761.1 hypothetical protein DFA_02500 [Cavenderia fasciculata]|eukprot:XP_004357223.1 hypothetical protein DFA_02500 [Cavenderia fasciculata]
MDRDPIERTLSDSSDQVMKNSEVSSDSSSRGGDLSSESSDNKYTNNSNENTGSANSNDNDVESNPNKKVQSGFLSSSLFYFKISLWFLGYSVISGATTALLIPFQVQTIHPERHEYWNGVVPIAGMFVNLISTPVFGYLSDRTKTPFGKRRPYILFGTIIMLIFLALMARFNKQGDSIGAYIVILMAYNFGYGIAGGAFSGIIPDIVHVSQAGIASGWLGVTWSIGMLTGSLMSGHFLLNYPTLWPLIGTLIAILGATSLAAVILLWEDSYDEWSYSGSFKEFFSSLYLPSAIYYDFYWVLITRFFNTMGVNMILQFILYFSNQVLLRPSPLETSIALTVIIVFSIPASIVGGYLADFFNTKLLVYISSSIQVVAIALLIAVCFSPSYAGFLTLAGLLGVGYGCYQCVDWALALHSLPNRTIGKDMGIWHLSFIAPAVIAPFISGNILDRVIPTHGYPTAYAVVFGVATLWFILATVFIFPMKVHTFGRRKQQRMMEQQQKEKEKQLNNQHSPATAATTTATATSTSPSDGAV